jgi:NitT/TauT family transport system substrate-binding protein
MSNRIVRAVGPLLVVMVWLSGTRGPSLAQEKMIPLKVSLSDVDVTKIIAYIAADEGIYKKNGLEVDQAISPSAATVARRRGAAVPAQYVRAIDAPIGLGGGSPLVLAVATDALAGDRVILATLDHIVHWHIMARPEIKTVEDLKGKRLGISNATDMTFFFARALAQKMGWNPVLDLSIMINGSALDTLKSGKVDAVVATQLLQQSAAAAGFPSIVDTRAWRIPIPGSGINSTKTWVRENPEATRRFVRSMVEAIAVLKRHKDVAMRAMGKYYGFTPEQQEASYEGNKEMPTKPYPAIDGIKKAMELFDSREMRKHKPEDFYDDTFVRELDKSGFIDGLYK